MPPKIPTSRSLIGNCEVLTGKILLPQSKVPLTTTTARASNVIHSERNIPHGMLRASLHCIPYTECGVLVTSVKKTHARLRPTVVLVVSVTSDGTSSIVWQGRRGTQYYYYEWKLHCILLPDADIPYRNGFSYQCPYSLHSTMVEFTTPKDADATLKVTSNAHSITTHSNSIFTLSNNILYIHKHAREMGEQVKGQRSHEETDTTSTFIALRRF